MVKGDDLMRIQMESQMGRIGMRTQPSQLQIEQPKADYELIIDEPKVRVESTLPKVQISQQQAFSESGLKGILELTSETAQIAKQLMFQGMSRVNQQGDELADIHKPDPLPDHAKYNAYDQFKKDYNVATMPKSGPDIEVIEGVLDIQVEEGNVDIQSKPNNPVIDYRMGKVEIYMDQYPSLKIWVSGNQFDHTI